MTQKSSIKGFIRAIADQQHPLQTRLSLILTDFEPNGNKQGIPREEKDNIIRTAQYMPLKINFSANDGSYTGHTGAFPIGPIISAYEGEDNGRAVIMGDAVIWDEVYKDISDHLRHAFSEGVGTSWEIYFEDTTKDDNGVEWLSGCVFAGTCVVEVPAYGPNRTRVLAIAEQLAASEDILHNLEINMGADNVAAADTQSMDDTRNELIQVQDVLFKIWEGVDTLFNKTFEIEQAQVETDIGKIAAQFAEKLAKLADRINELHAASSELESVKAELDSVKKEKADAELAQAKAERIAKLSDVGIDTSDEQRVARYVDMPEDSFTALLSDFQAIRTKNSANAEQHKDPVVLPEPLGNTGNMSVSELSAALLDHITKNKK